MILGRIRDFDLVDQLPRIDFKVGYRYRIEVKVTEVAELDDGDLEIVFVVEDVEL
jgi:hypothetical protein